MTISDALFTQLTQNRDTSLSNVDASSEVMQMASHMQALRNDCHTQIMTADETLLIQVEAEAGLPSTHTYNKFTDRFYLQIPNSIFTDEQFQAVMNGYCMEF
ncbi:hypothetical protein GC177_06880 [bacterium]|nr:hypothetical protein [bacterium]